MSNIPLYIVTGAGGSGKTFVLKELRRMMPDFNVFDYDDLIPFIIENKKNFKKSDTYKLQNIWLRVAKNIAESGRKTILCGIIVPQDIERCTDFHYFKQINFLVLHCDDKTREIRLRARKTMTEKKLTFNKNLAKWFIENAAKYTPPMPIIDTSKTDVTKVAEQIKKWIDEYP